jgi:hypothetical protein
VVLLSAWCTVLGWLARGRCEDLLRPGALPRLPPPTRDLGLRDAFGRGGTPGLRASRQPKLVHHVPVMDDGARDRRDMLLDERTRRLAMTTVAAAAIAWWPAFTMGTYGVVFFEQLLTLWVVASSVFLVGAVSLRGRLLRRPEWWALLVPSLWLVAALILPPGGTSLSPPTCSSGSGSP